MDTHAFQYYSSHALNVLVEIVFEADIDPFRPSLPHPWYCVTSDFLSGLLTSQMHPLSMLTAMCYNDSFVQICFKCYTLHIHKERLLYRCS